MEISSFTSPFAPLHDTSRELVNRICPLFAMKGPRQPFLIGTGVPLQIGSVSVIATAAHVLDKIGPASVLTFSRERSLLLSGERRGFGHQKGKHIDVDLAVIVLTRDERQQLRKRYTFSYSLEYAYVPPLKQLSFYTLVGFPHSRNKPSPRLLREARAEALYYVVNERLALNTVKSDDKFAQVHFALSAPSRYVTSPSGMSGGGVWWLDSSGPITRAPVPRLIGIGIEYCRQPGAFICTRVGELDAMVADLQVR